VLLQDKVWKYRDDLVAYAVGMLIDHFDQPEVFKFVVLVNRAHPGIRLVVRLCRRDGLRYATPAIRADRQTATLA
jgi:hypothetical protein